MSIGYLLTQGLGDFTVGGTSGELSVINKALLMLGEKKIDALSDTNKRAVAANELYPASRDAVLELYIWKSARTLATLTQDSTWDLSGVTWLADVATATLAAGHDIEVGDSVTVAGVTPTDYNVTATVVAVPTSTTFTYALDLDADPGAGGAGTVLNPLTPNWKYGNQFSLPSDFVRLVKLEDEAIGYEIYGSKVVTDEATIKIEYIYAMTDVSAMNQALRDSISAKLSYDLSYHLDTSSNKQKDMERVFDRTLALSKNIDASQRQEDKLESDEWKLGRLRTVETFRPFSV